MTLRLRRPSQDEVAEVLLRCREDAFTYGPSGGSLDGSTPPRRRLRRWWVDLSAGSFDRAVEALTNWKVHRGAGLMVAADGGIEAGTNVALVAPLPIGWVDATCRIVTVVNEPDTFGFAYGTLRVHPERGEESFVVRRSAERGAVRGRGGFASSASRGAPRAGNRTSPARPCRRSLSRRDAGSRGARLVVDISEASLRAARRYPPGRWSLSRYSELVL